MGVTNKNETNTNQASRRSQQSPGGDLEHQNDQQLIQSDNQNNHNDSEGSEDTVSNMTLYLIMCSMLIFGTFNTVIMKMQDDVQVGTSEDGTPKTFNHPYFQCAIMFIGEFFCMILYGFKYLWTRRSGHSGVNPLVLSIPAMFDIIGSSFMFVALTMVAASVYQMMRGFIVVIVAFMALVFLGKPQYAHHWISLSLIVLGVFIVGFVNIMAAKTEVTAQSTTSILGILLLLGAQCFTGGQFVTEEKILGGQSLDPLYIVGLEGLWGCCIFAVLLPIFQNVQCTNELCHNGKIEDSLLAMRMFQEHPVLLAQSCCNILSIAGFNAAGVMITKYASAAQRSTVDTCRTLLIWVVFLAAGKEKFLIGELAGFIILVFGTLVYNEIVEVPIMFMNVNTRRNLQQRQERTREKRAGLSVKGEKSTLDKGDKETAGSADETTSLLNNRLARRELAAAQKDLKAE